MGMEWEEAEALMAAEAEVRGVGLDEAQRRVLYQRTAGLPLPIRLSVARLTSGETFEQVVRWLGGRHRRSAAVLRGWAGGFGLAARSERLEVAPGLLPF